jgi:hypothetical protein
MEHENTKINELPTDILIYIFLFLPHLQFHSSSLQISNWDRTSAVRECCTTIHLSNVSLVNRSWFNASCSDIIWHPLVRSLLNATKSQYLNIFDKFKHRFRRFEAPTRNIFYKSNKETPNNNNMQYSETCRNLYIAIKQDILNHKKLMLTDIHAKLQNNDSFMPPLLLNGGKYILSDLTSTGSDVSAITSNINSFIWKALTISTFILYLIGIAIIVYLYQDRLPDLVNVLLLFICLISLIYIPLQLMVLFCIILKMVTISTIYSSIIALCCGIVFVYCVIGSLCILTLLKVSFLSYQLCWISCVFLSIILLYLLVISIEKLNPLGNSMKEINVKHFIRKYIVYSTGILLIGMLVISLRMIIIYRMMNQHLIMTLYLLSLILMYYISLRNIHWKLYTRAILREIWHQHISSRKKNNYSTKTAVKFWKRHSFVTCLVFWVLCSMISDLYCSNSILSTFLLWTIWLLFTSNGIPIAK